jgi:hypothetical protein
MGKLETVDPSRMTRIHRLRGRRREVSIACPSSTPRPRGGHKGRSAHRGANAARLRRGRRASRIHVGDHHRTRTAAATQSVDLGSMLALERRDAVRAGVPPADQHRATPHIGRAQRCRNVAGRCVLVLVAQPGTSVRGAASALRVGGSSVGASLADAVVPDEQHTRHRAPSATGHRRRLDAQVAVAPSCHERRDRLSLLIIRSDLVPTTSPDASRPPGVSPALAAPARTPQPGRELRRPCRTASSFRPNSTPSRPHRQ